MFQLFIAQWLNEAIPPRWNETTRKIAMFSIFDHDKWNQWQGVDRQPIPEVLTLWEMKGGQLMRREKTPEGIAVQLFSTKQKASEFATQNGMTLNIIGLTKRRP